MPLFTKDTAARAPFGKNQYLRSTTGVRKESYTMAATGIPSETIDGVATKVLQPGTVIAKITSGGDSGKVGVFDTGATDGRQTTANIVGINDTFLPWQLMEGDREIAVTYDATVVTAWCFQYTTGVRAALSIPNRDAIDALTSNALLFK